MRAPALYALIFFVAGIILASQTTFPALGFLGIAVVSTAAAVIYALVNRTLSSRIALCVALFTSSAFLTKLQLNEIPANHISHFLELDGKSTILGRVVSEPDIRPTKTFLTVAAESLSHQGITIAVSGRIRLRVARPTNEFNIDDRIRFTGFVVKPLASRNPGAFDYSRYLEIRGICGICNLGDFDQVERVEMKGGRGFVRSIVVPVREYITSVFEDHLPPDQSALMRGFLIGDVRFIPTEVYQRFKDTGTLHVLAASGSNVGYVTLTIFLVARLFHLPRRSRYFLAIVGVVIFSFLAYNQPSVVRASVMAVVALIGMSLRRDQNWLNTISVAGLIVLAVHPLYLYDLGTQLSFAAAFSLILFMPTLEPLLPKSKKFPIRIARYFFMIFFGSVVAQLGVMPILLYHFHTVPLVSFLSNLVIVPLVGLAASAGIVLIFISAIPMIPGICGVLLESLLDSVHWATVFFENLRIPPLQLGAPELLTVLTYYLLLQVVLTIGARSRHFLSFLVLFIVALNVIVWKAVIAGPEIGTRLTILDTSKLTTIFVEEANGETVLINGGGKSQYFDNGESVVLPFLRFRGIETIGEICRTTEREGNSESLATIAESLDLQKRSKLATARDSFRSLDPVVRFQIDSVTFLFLTESVSVQNLNTSRKDATVLGLDWSFLAKKSAEEVIEMFRPETVVFTNYVSRYSKIDYVVALRNKFPTIRIISVLESGAVEFEVNKNNVSIWTSANK